MPSASHRRAQAAKKTDQAKLATTRKSSKMSGQYQAKETTKGFHASKDAAGNTVNTYVNARGEIISIVEAPLPAVWPYQVVNPDDDGGDKSSFAYEHRRQKIFASLGAAFEWEAEPVDTNSVYNAAHPRNPFHSEWLKYQQAFNKTGPKTYAPTSVPYNLQNASEQGIDLSMSSDSSSSSSDQWRPKKYAKECLYWPLGTCKNGDKCSYFHDVAKEPKGKPGNNNVCWFWKQGKCTKGGHACKYDHFE